jgi:hypothetical protein
MSYAELTSASPSFGRHDRTGGTVLPVLHAQPLGKSVPPFKQPSLAPGVDYVVRTEAGIEAAIDRVRDYFIRTTPYHIIDLTPPPDR